MKKMIALTLVLVMALSLAACTQGADPGEKDPAPAAGQDGQNPQADLEYIECGNADAAQGDGENALKNYTAALELRESAEAYLGLVDAHIMLHEFEAAYDTAILGSDKTGDSRLQEKAAALKQGSAVDAAGREHKFSHYTDGELDWYRITDYTQGEKIYAVTSYDSNDLQTGKIIYEYDDMGNVTLGSYCWWDDGIVRPSLRTYNEQGQLIQSVQQGDETHHTYGDIYEYGSDGQISRSEYYMRWLDGLYAITYYEWTDFGKRAKETDYNPDGTLQDYTIYEYNDKQQKIKCTYYNADDSVDFYYTFEYDNAGNLISETRHEG